MRKSLLALSACSCLWLAGCGSSVEQPLVATKVDFVGQPTSVLVSQGSLGLVRVAALTADGQVASGATGSVTVSLVSADTSAHLTGTTTMALAQGVATFNLTIARAGTDYRLVARAAGFDSVVSQHFAVTPGPAVGVRIDPYEATTFTVTQSVPTVVRLVDASGNFTTTPASAIVTLGFSRVASYGLSLADGIISSGSDPGGTSKPAVNGFVIFRTVNFQKTGVYRTLAAGDISVSPRGGGADSTATYVVRPGPMTQLMTVAGAGVRANRGALLPEISVQPFDVFRNSWGPTTGPAYSVTVSLVSFDPASGGVLTGTLTKQGTMDQPVTFNDLRVDTPGVYTILASWSNGTSAQVPVTIQ